MSPNAIDPRLSAPHRLYFWSNENLDTHKPPHVHVESSDGWAEFWLAPVGIKHRGTYNARDLQKARRKVVAFEFECLSAWEKFHGRG